ncbi:helix-turn-helix transcriptional regulator [Bordetella genomosp. 13]|uniref:helix-turn-helix transcriptional regulator n=1 Tax=Bordetella genomosp. 13 TaxID=463040 RepID=UPI0011A6B43D|nr:transcriptional regulator [Bordetella genomosp. 13]
MDPAYELSIASALYEGVTNASRWQEALHLAAHVLDTDRGAFLARHQDTGRILVDEVTGHDAPMIAEYEAHYQEQDIINAVSHRIPTGGSFLDQRDAPSAMRNTSFYNDFLHRHGIGSLLMAFPLRQDGMEHMVSFQREHRRGPFEARHEETLRRLVPHLQRAIELRLKLRSLERQATWSLAALEAFSTPILLLDASGRLLSSNQSAQRWYAQHAGRLRDNAEWRRLLATATGKLGLARAAGHRLSAEGGYAVALPAPSAHAHGLPDGPIALVVIHPDRLRTPVPHDVLKDLFHFSQAECRLLDCLMIGQTLSQAAATLGVAMETARTQTKSMLHKTGTHRQAELLRLASLLQGPA